MFSQHLFNSICLWIMIVEFVICICVSNFSIEMNHFRMNDIFMFEYTFKFSHQMIFCLNSLTINNKQKQNKKLFKHLWIIANKRSDELLNLIIIDCYRKLIVQNNKKWNKQNRIFNFHVLWLTYTEHNCDRNIFFSPSLVIFDYRFNYLL